MTSIGDIILSREKTTVRPDQADDGSPEPFFELRSNRTVFKVVNPPMNDTVVVRGHTLPGTIRMTGVVVAEVDRDRAALHANDKTDWERRWLDTVPEIDQRFMPGNWASVHVNGTPLFASTHNDRLDLIEREAQGREIDDRIVRSASTDIVGQAERVMVEHDSQTALVLTETVKWTKCAILERKSGRTGSFAMTLYHDGPVDRPAPSELLFVAADLVEAMNLDIFIESIRAMVRQNRIDSPAITPERVQATVERQTELRDKIGEFEKGRRVFFTPDKPSFLMP